MSADQEETAGQDVPLDAGLDVPETPEVTSLREQAAAAAELEEPSDDPMIAALLREREGYLQYGRKDRAAGVDAELKRLGYKKAEAKKAAPKGRATRESKQTTATSSKPAKKTAAKKP